MSRDQAATVGRETVQILEAGCYRAPSGRLVDIADLLRQAVEGTRDYPPEQPLVVGDPSTSKTAIAVVNETTLTAARREVESGASVLALNFASGTNPGGGFLTGSRAQEESLVRSSGLYACLRGNPMYDFHRANSDPMYSDHAIYSPNVPVIRTDEGALLEQPWSCSFLTCAAVNAKQVFRRDPSRGAAIADVMSRRIRRILAIAAAQRHDTLILGAWGCGAFANDVEQVAAQFKEALHDTVTGVFGRVVFAVTDWSRDQRFLGPFGKRFVSGFIPSERVE